MFCTVLLVLQLCTAEQIEYVMLHVKIFTLEYLMVRPTIIQLFDLGFNVICIFFKFRIKHIRPLFLEPIFSFYFLGN